MNYLNSRIGCYFASAILVGLGMICQAQGSQADLADTPAAINSNAQGSVLIAVARAGKRLVAVGERGAILLSDDNGGRWRQASNVPVSVALTAISFADADHGWAVGHGGVILQTADGGESWSKQLDGNHAANLELQAAQSNSSENSQVSARRLQAARQLVVDGADKPFLAVFFADAEHGLAVGAYGLAVGTSDGGKHWHSLMGAMDNPGGMHLYSILADKGGVFIVGEQGMLLTASQLEQPFHRLKSPYSGTFFGAVRRDNGRLIVFGLKGNAYELDEDEQWHSVATGEGASLTSSVLLKDGTVLIASEGGRLLRSVKDNQNFQVIRPAAIDGAPITGVVQASDGDVVVTGLRGVKRLTLASLNEEIKP